ncbi:MAG TPA: hypothetical protein PJ989_03960 [Oligoflexia bacterium]|nr:hypothetical protein [Oligoflexia bacterium]
MELLLLETAFFLALVLEETDFSGFLFFNFKPLEALEPFFCGFNALACDFGDLGEEACFLTLPIISAPGISNNAGEYILK